jgi:hypothetical protein
MMRPQRDKMPRKPAPRDRHKAAPSRIVAAEFLRALARDAALPCRIPEQRAADLRLIADCIEGRVKWAKPLAHAFREQQEINFAAFQVERRPEGELVNNALDRWARWLAPRIGLRGPDAEETARGWIADARKRQRKAGWPTLLGK